MKKGALSIVILIALLIPLVSAEDTEIKVKTLPYHEVQLTTYDSGKLESFKGESDRFGDVIFTSTASRAFNIIVFIKWDGETITTKTLNDEFPPGETVEITAAPPGAKLLDTPTPEPEEVEEVVEEVPEITEEIVEEVPEETQEEITEETDASITGFSVLTDSIGKYGKNAVFYVIGVICGKLDFMVGKSFYFNFSVFCGY